MLMKQIIREYILNLKVDDVGFASIADYESPRSPKIEGFFPGAKSIIVLAYKELSYCESPNMQLAMNGRLDRNAVIHYNNYLISHFIESRFHTKILSIPTGFTMDVNNPQMGASDFSLRHAAVAAGLGNLGRHNLVIHPRFGTRVNFSAIITSLKLDSDAGITEDLCIHCNLCVDNCPARALDEEGKTDVRKCLKTSRQFGANQLLMYLDKFMNSTQEDKNRLLASFSFMPYYQAISGERDYCCFNCLKHCPVGH